MCVWVGWSGGGFYFFFFQAEDGIRDHCVTGVQTCALPISLDRDADEVAGPEPPLREPPGDPVSRGVERSEERRVGKSVDLGGRRRIKKKIKRERGPKEKVITNAMTRGLQARYLRAKKALRR